LDTQTANKFDPLSYGGGGKNGTALYNQMNVTKQDGFDDYWNQLNPSQQQEMKSGGYVDQNYTPSASGQQQGNQSGLLSSYDSSLSADANPSASYTGDFGATYEHAPAGSTGNIARTDDYTYSTGEPITRAQGESQRDYYRDIDNYGNPAHQTFYDTTYDGTTYAPGYGPDSQATDGKGDYIDNTGNMIIPSSNVDNNTDSSTTNMDPSNTPDTSWNNNTGWVDPDSSSSNNNNLSGVLGAFNTNAGSSQLSDLLGRNAAPHENYMGKALGSQAASNVLSGNPNGYADLGSAGSVYNPNLHDDSGNQHSNGQINNNFQAEHSSQQQQAKTI